MADRTLWMLVTVSRTWPWDHRSVLERELGEQVAWARDRGFTRFVMVHGAYGWSKRGEYLHTPPRSDAMARILWVDGWKFAEEPLWPDWNVYGNAAGPIRNAAMVQSVVRHVTENPGDAARCEAFIAGDSRGATNTADLADRAGIMTRRHSLADVLVPPKRQGRSTKPSRFERKTVRANPIERGIPNVIPGPCGRCGRVSYLITDDVLFRGDGYCVYWDARSSRWRAACGLNAPIVRPADSARIDARSSASQGVLVGQAATRTRRAS